MNTEHLLQKSGTPGQSSATEPMPTKTSIRETAQSAGQQLKQKAAETGEQLKNKGSEALDQVRQQAQEMAEQRRADLLERLQHCSAASRRAAEQLRQDNDPMMAGYAEALAAQIDRGSDYFRGRDLRGLIADTENFARRRPEIFFGGLFVAGLALARFLKASSRHQERHEFREVQFDEQEEHHSEMVDLYSEAQSDLPETKQPMPPTSPGMSAGIGSAGAPITGTVPLHGGPTPSANPNPGLRPGSASGSCGCS